MFQDKVAVITGGAGGIGRCIAASFCREGARVCVIDVVPQADDAIADLYVQGDIADESALCAFVDQVINKYGRVDYLINNAPPLFKGIDDCTYEEFNRALRVGVSAPFMLTKLFKDHFAPGASIVNISSSRDRMSMPQSESYTAAKGGISALTHALAVSLSGRVRVNSISPGWIETGEAIYTGADAVQHPAGRVGKPEDIADMTLFLCSDKAGFITGENICIDGGMTRLMIYHGDHGWSYDPKSEKA
jgi:NAD(P)-dependent dehydrogenase (short-subunit alcohol dehydrogenase family)